LLPLLLRIPIINEFNETATRVELKMIEIQCEYLIRNLYELLKKHLTGEAEG